MAWIAALISQQSFDLDQLEACAVHLIFVKKFWCNPVTGVSKVIRTSQLSGIRCGGNAYIEETVMQAWVAPLKLFSYVVVALMLVAIVYAAFISIKYWSGIGV